MNLHKTIIINYKKYLNSLSITSGTIRSYLSDIRHFLAWYTFFVKSQGIKTKEDKPFEFLKYIKTRVVDQYTEYQISNQTPTKTINRRLSALRKFGSFCQSQNWINQNVFSNARNITDATASEESENHLEEYKVSLTREGYSPQSIKSYLSDVRQFINWLDYSR